MKVLIKTKNDQAIVNDHPWFKNPNYPLLMHKVLLGAGRPIVIAAKKIFYEAIVKYSRIYDGINKENSIHVNTHLMLDCRKEFFERNPEVPKRDMIEAAFQIIAGEHETNHEYRVYWEDLMRILKSKDWVITTKEERGNDKIVLR